MGSIDNGMEYTDRKEAAKAFETAELESKEDRLKILTDELNKAAIKVKKNAPKRDAMRIAKKPKQDKKKSNHRDKKR